MLASERRLQIEERLLRQKVLDIVGLAEELKVSPMTIRRDLDRLAQAGKAQRVYGGAMAVALSGELAYQEKVSLHIDEKQRIAQRAFELIQPGETVMLATGTTTKLIAERMVSFTDHTVITNGVDIAEVLRPADRIRTIMLGGELRRSCAVVGPSAERQVAEIHYVDRLFIGVDGLSPDHGLTTHHPLEARLYSLMMKKAREVIVVADSTKVGKVAFCLIADCCDANLLITDSELNPADREALEGTGLRVEVV